MMILAIPEKQVMDKTRWMEEAIIIRHKEQGESDLYVIFLTRNKGKLSGIAKGARRSRKRFMNTLDPFSFVKLSCLSRNKRALIIEEGELIESFSMIRKEYLRYLYACLFLEMVDKLSPFSQPLPELYDLIISVMRHLDSASTDELDWLYLYFFVHFLGITGYHPLIQRCVSCNAIADSLRYLFPVYSEGGFYCLSCMNTKKYSVKGAKYIPIGLIKALEFIKSHDIKKAKRLRLSKEKILTLLEHLNRFWEVTPGISLSSLDMIKSHKRRSL